MFRWSGWIVVEVSKKLTFTDKKLERFNASHAYKNVWIVLSSILGGFIIQLFGIKINFMLTGVLLLFNVWDGIIYFESNLNKKEEHHYQIFKNNINDEEMNHFSHNKNLNFFSVLNNKNILILYILHTTYIFFKSWI